MTVIHANIVRYVTGVRVIAAAGLLAASSACSSPTAPLSSVPPGMYGGEGASLTVSEEASHLRLSYVVGDIPRVIGLDARGQFDTTGTVVKPCIHDPIRVHDARFTGRATGNLVVLTVRLNDTNETFGPFMLSRGRDGHFSGPC